MRTWANTDKTNGKHTKNGNGVAHENLTKRPPPGSYDYINRDIYEFGDYGYGKSHVKMLHVLRQGAVHSIREVEVDIHLKLDTTKDYLDGDNKDIVATDSQKNTLYVLAKNNGIKTPEEFGLLVCAHFLYTYKHVKEVEVNIEEYPWERLQAEEQDHNHAFVFSPSATRFAIVTQCRNESPILKGGLKGLRVLKTTQSAFTDFVQDSYRTLPDAKDRIFCTEVTAVWEFSTANGVDFDNAWTMVKDCILDNFAGPPESGIFSPSVQNTLYLAEKTILDKVPQISRIEMQMPNKHYLTVDMSKFPASVLEDKVNEEVYNPVDKPSGVIHAELLRKHLTAKL